MSNRRRCLISLAEVRRAPPPWSRTRGPAAASTPSTSGTGCLCAGTSSATAERDWPWWAPRRTVRTPRAARPLACRRSRPWSAGARWGWQWGGGSACSPRSALSVATDDRGRSSVGAEQRAPAPGGGGHLLAPFRLPPPARAGGGRRLRGWPAVTPGGQPLRADYAAVKGLVQAFDKARVWLGTPRRVGATARRRQPWRCSGGASGQKCCCHAHDSSRARYRAQLWYSKA